MKTLVCISNVPDTTAKVSFTDDNTQFNTSAVQFVLNPYDEIALARALEFSEGGKGTVTVIHVGTASAEPTIRKALAIGADDAVRIDAEPSDSFFVAKQIAEYARNKSFDLILTGRESIDYNNAQVPGILGELLDMPVVLVKKFDVLDTSVSLTRAIEGGNEILSANFPVILSCTESVAEPRIPNMRGIMAARTKPLEVIEAVSVAPKTKIVNFETPEPRGKVKLFSTEQVAEVVEVLHTDAKVI